MTPPSLLAAALLVAASPVAAQPRLVNGRIQSQSPASGLDRSFKTILAGEVGPAWIGYVAPMVEGERALCCFESGGASAGWPRDGCCGSCRLEPGGGLTMTTGPRPAAQPGVVRLEGPERVIVLYRIVDRRVDKIRVFTEDCELDAGGRTVHWLSEVTAADSVALLTTLAVPSADRRDRLADSATMAIAMHRGAEADSALDRLVAAGQPEPVRKTAVFWLGNVRGRRGFETLSRLVRQDASDQFRKSAVFALTQSHEPEAVDTIIAVARDDRSGQVRGEALFWLAQKAGAKAAATITEAIERDPETEVKTRAVFALSRLPKDEGVPLLIQVARTNANPVVRKQAIFWLGQSRDPRALAFFEEILRPAR